MPGELDGDHAGPGRPGAAGESDPSLGFLVQSCRQRLRSATGELHLGRGDGQLGAVEDDVGDGFVGGGLDADLAGEGGRLEIGSQPQLVATGLDGVRQAVAAEGSDRRVRAVVSVIGCTLPGPASSPLVPGPGVQRVASRSVSDTHRRPRARVD